MEVEKMIEEMSDAICEDFGTNSRAWSRAAQVAAKAVGIPLETLAALRSGSWKAVPVEPTDKMFEGYRDAIGYREEWTAMLAAAPAKPGDE